LRVVIADDEVLLREGLDRLLTEAGIEVVGKVGNAGELLRKVRLTQPDVAIIDIRMPPTHTDEGIGAAVAIRSAHPETAVLILSHYLDSRYALRVMQEHPGGVGYLLKDRVSDLALLTDALTRLQEGECVIDPTIVSRLVRPSPVRSSLNDLTEREQEVLALIAEGRSNKGICERLFLSPKTVEAHVKHVLQKLDIDASPDDHRRVLAVLVYLRAAAAS
jgi:DNA-binding NarL/FixJ family response regulator